MTTTSPRFQQFAVGFGALCLGWIAKDALGDASSSAESAAPGPALKDLLAASAERERASPPIELTIVLDGKAMPAGTIGPGGGASGAKITPGAQPARDHSGGARSYGGRSYSGRSYGGRSSGVPAEVTGPHGAPSTGGVPYGRTQIARGPTSYRDVIATAVGEDIVVAYDDTIVMVGDNGRLTGNTGDSREGGVVALDSQKSNFTTNRPPAGAHKPGGHPASPRGQAGKLSTGRAGSSPHADGPVVAGHGEMLALARDPRRRADDDLAGMTDGTDGDPISPEGPMAPMRGRDGGTRGGVPASTGYSPMGRRGGGTPGYGNGNGGYGNGYDTDGYGPHDPHDPDAAAGGGDFVPNAPPGAVSPLISPIVSFSHGRPVDIAGYEDHSLSVRGQRNVVTYDDTNVFIDRDGKLNGNTGDTDSAGLNAVDTVRSNVSSGPHCDDGCDDESILQARFGAFDEADVAYDSAGNPIWDPTPEENGAANGQDENGEEEEEEEEEDEVTPSPDPAETEAQADSALGTQGTPPLTGEDGEFPGLGGIAAEDPLIIGGDGYDDLGVRVDGYDNIVSYDDSNVVLRGSGDVNAQIGDSDTGGTVTMNTVDSQVHGNQSR